MSDRSRTYKTEGVVLHRRNIGEADSIFTVFSEREGKFEAVARGVRKPKSHLRGHMEPLTRSHFMVARGRSLDVVTQAETICAYRAIRDDLERGAEATYGAELIDRFAIDRAEQPGLYALLLDFLDGLEGGAPLQITRCFEVQLLALMGYELQLDACTLCTLPLEPVETLLSPSAGGLVCVDCRASAGGGRVLSLRALKVLRYARSSGIAAFAAVRFDDALAHEMQNGIGGVIRYVLDHDVLSGRFVDQVARLAPAGSRAAPAAPPERDHVQ